ncbi:MAG: NAD-dependent epimerase/dehydratase family protein [Candidatus Baltobacteraceae bacterium]
MKLLLTGATGFLGRSVTRRLAEHGHTLFALVRTTSNVEPIAGFLAARRTGDITDPLAVRDAADGVDAIVHLAADLGHWSARRADIHRINVSGTRVVAEAAKTAGVPRLLHVSSVAAVGYSADGVPIDEYAPNNFRPLRLVYHESKRLAEEEALDARRYGVAVTIVNPGVVYGPRGLDHAFGHTMLEIAAGRVPGHPTGGLSVVDVEDVATGIAMALERAREGERYILSGDNVHYAELFARQAEVVGRRYRGRPLPSALLHLAAIAFETRARFDGREPRLTRDNATIAPLLMWYSHERARAELDFRPRPLGETLERMARAYRDAGILAPR